MGSDTRSDPRRTGGLTSYFQGESSAGTQSTLGWDRVRLTAKKLMVLTKESNELREDAVLNIGDKIAGEIAYEFASKEDDCGFNGDGTSTYGGIVGVRSALTNLNGTVANIAGLTVATGSGYGTNYNSVTLADFNNVIGNLPEYADANAKWYVSKFVWGSVMQRLALAAGGVTELGIMGGAKQKMFLGYPVEISQKLPRSRPSTRYAPLFGDLSAGARFGDRRQTTIQVSDSALNAFEQDEFVIRGTERFDIVVHDVGNASATATSRQPGPIVGLITSGS
jgi:HK97 family phage major capsid protein